MKKIRLTEAELTNIIKRVINEQPTSGNEDVKIPEVIKEKSLEISQMAKNIIKKHMDFCKYMMNNKSKFSEVFKDSSRLSMDCEVATKNFADQPLSSIADLTKTLTKSDGLMMMGRPSFKSKP
jgi:hypothetical protein